MSRAPPQKLANQRSDRKKAGARSISHSRPLTHETGLQSAGRESPLTLVMFGPARLGVRAAPEVPVQCFTRNVTCRD